MTWLPIKYRDFWDVPRMFVVEYLDDLYLFDCAFDDETGDFSERYAIYRLPRAVEARLAAGPWTDLPSLGERVADTPVAAVRFDPTHRRYVDGRIFEELGLDPYSEREDPALVRLPGGFAGY